MTKREIATTIADIHNELTEIMVKGDDAIRMGLILSTMRQLFGDLQREAKAEESDGNKEREDSQAVN